MPIPFQLTFRNIAPSAAIETHVRERIVKLESFYHRLISCRITIEAPHRHHHKGKIYRVRVELAVPGPDIVVNRTRRPLAAADLKQSQESEMALVENREPGRYAAHADIYVAIRDAFNAAGRKLQDLARRQNGAAKLHGTASRAWPTRVFPEERSGFLEAADGDNLSDAGSDHPDHPAEISQEERDKRSVGE